MNTRIAFFASLLVVSATAMRAQSVPIATKYPSMVMPIEEEASTSSAAAEMNIPSSLDLRSGASTGIQPIGISPNCYSVIATSPNQVAYNADLDALTFVHRQTTSGGSSGGLGIDRSLDGGATWMVNNLVTPGFEAGLFPNVTGNRYPSVALSNPPGNTNPANAVVSITAPALQPGGSWAWTATHSARLSDLSVTNESYASTQPGLLVDFLPSSLGVNDATGELWSISGTLGGTTGIPNYQFVNINRGTLNLGTQSIDWALGDTILVPSYNMVLEDGIGAPENYAVAEWVIEFSPDGLVGYAAFLGSLTTSVTNTLQPIVLKTTNGGNTWSLLPSADMTVFPELQSFLLPTQQGPVIPYWTTMDGVVDANGRFHMFSRVNSRSTTAADSADFIWVGQNLELLCHFTVSSGVDWTARVLDTIETENLGSPVVGGLVHNTRVNMSRSQDGSKVFFLWSATDDLFTSINELPDVYIKGYEATLGIYTPTKAPSKGTPFEASIFWPSTSNRTRESGSSVDYEMPIVFSNPTGTDLDPLVHFYLSGAGFNAADFGLTACNSAVPPTNQASTLLTTRAVLTWDPNPGAVGCQLQGKKLPSGGNPTVNILSGDIGTSNVPYALAGPGSTWTWRVRCACSIGPPVDASPFTIYGDTFSIPLAKTEADLALEQPESGILVWPTAASQTAFLRYRAKVSGPHAIEWMDIHGRVIAAREAQLEAGQEYWDQLDIIDQASGQYLVAVHSAEGRQSAHFSVVR